MGFGTGNSIVFIATTGEAFGPDERSADAPHPRSMADAADQRGRRGATVLRHRSTTARQEFSVVGSTVGEQVAAQGAAELVMDHFLAPRASVLVMD